MTTTREEILTYIAYKLSVVDGLETVRRKPISSVQELQEIPHTLFPIVTVSGGLPSPEGGNPVELGDESYYSAIRSNLGVFIRVFGIEKNAPDSAISTTLNLIYPALYYDPTFKGYNYTTKSPDASVVTGDVVLCVENMMEPYTFNFYEALDDFTLGSIAALPFGVPAKFTNVTSTLTGTINYVSLNPTGIMEYRDPYYVYTLTMDVNYTHKTLEI